MNKKEIGNMGEYIASKYLENLKYEIIKRNYYTRFGEIDIIAKKENEIIFVEVKTRCNNLFGSPAESINNTKKKHIYKSAKYFLYKTKQEKSFTRVDVIEIYIIDKEIRIKHLKQIM